MIADRLFERGARQTREPRLRLPLRLSRYAQVRGI